MATETHLHSLQEIRLFVTDEAVRTNKPFTLLHNENRKFIAGCPEPSCPFRIRFTNKKGTFVLTKHVQHECFKVGANVSSTWVASKISVDFASSPNVSGSQIVDHIKTAYGVDISIQKAFRAKVKAFVKDLDGDASFNKLKPFLQMAKESDARTVVDLQEVNQMFVSAFLCPEFCVNAFNNSLKVVFLDACSLRCKMKGVLMVASTLDGNDQIVPLACGVAPIENIKHWTLFVSRLSTALHLPDIDQLVVISDRDKGLVEAVTIILPNAHHAFCLRHISENLLKRAKGVQDLLWRAASSFKVGEFEENMETIRSVSEIAHTFLVGTNPASWARALFAPPRYGHLTSNVAESCNHMLDELRQHLPLRLFLLFVEKVNSLFSARHDLYMRTTDVVPATVREMEGQILEKACFMKVLQSPGDVVEVREPSGERFVVGLQSRT